MNLKQRIGRQFMYGLFTNWRTISGIKFEVTAIGTRVLNVISPSIRGKRRILSSQKHLNINLGSGGRGKADWINIDVFRHHKDLAFPYDIRKGLPFAEGQIARIFAEHVIEHIEFREDLPRLLASALTALEPGGRIRIIVPDCERFVDAYLSRDPEKWRALGLDQFPSDMPTPMAMVNHVFQQNGEHMFAYDFETMKYVLQKAGFTEVQKMAYGQSSDPSLCLDRLEHASYSLYVEACKAMPQE